MRGGVAQVVLLGRDRVQGQRLLPHGQPRRLRVERLGGGQVVHRDRGQEIRVIVVLLRHVDELHGFVELGRVDGNQWFGCLRWFGRRLIVENEFYRDKLVLTTL